MCGRTIYLVMRQKLHEKVIRTSTIEEIAKDDRTPKVCTASNDINFKLIFILVYIFLNYIYYFRHSYF